MDTRSIEAAIQIINRKAGELFARECGISMPVSFCGSSIEIFAETSEAGRKLIGNLRSLKFKARNWDQERVIIRCPGAKDIEFSVSEDSNQTLSSNTEDMTFSNDDLVLKERLLGADYVKLHEFLIEQRQGGNIVIVTSNVTRDESGKPIDTENPVMGRDICHHTNDRLLPERAHWSAAQFTGYNYRLSWRYAFDDYGRLNSQYTRLKEILQRDGFVKDYQYTLFRPDGTQCEYTTSYYLCRDYLGDTVRIGISRPQDWRIIWQPNEPVQVVR